MVEACGAVLSAAEAVGLDCASAGKVSSVRNREQARERLFILKGLYGGVGALGTVSESSIGLVTAAGQK